MVEAETKPEGENVPICNDYNQALPTQRALRSTAAQKASNSAPRVVFRCSDNPHGEQRTAFWRKGQTFRSVSLPVLLCMYM